MSNTSAVEPGPVLLICGAIFRDDAPLAEALARLEQRFGPIADRSAVFPFDFTNYYEPEMGAGLQRQFFTFRQPIRADHLADIKNFTGTIEQDLARDRQRRVNLDPGYLTATKLVLATTKDFAHRIYLRDGIFAEVTLTFTRTGIRALPWTYPDFASDRYTPFLLEVRRRLLGTVA